MGVGGWAETEGWRCLREERRGERKCTDIHRRCLLVVWSWLWGWWQLEIRILAAYRFGSYEARVAMARKQTHPSIHPRDVTRRGLLNPYGMYEPARGLGSSHIHIHPPATTITLSIHIHPIPLQKYTPSTVFLPLLPPSFRPHTPLHKRYVPFLPPARSIPPITSPPSPPDPVAAPHAPPAEVGKEGL